MQDNGGDFLFTGHSIEMRCTWERQGCIMCVCVAEGSRECIMCAVWGAGLAEGILCVRMS